MTAPLASKTARQRAREEITHEMVRIAKEHLARDGGAGLSLRAVTREMGMASSAVYRYVPNRDALLTLLIIDAFNNLGAAVEKAEQKVPREQLLSRFLAVCHGVRTWAFAHPHEYALIYGSPVPGYSAPTDTVAPASRVTNLLSAILVKGIAAHPSAKFTPVDDAASASLSPIRAYIGINIPDRPLLQGLNAWTGIFGAVSFELFGHMHNVIASSAKARRAYFDYQMRSIGLSLGFE